MEATFIEAIKALGIAGGPVFAFLWWLERKERIECQKITKDLMVQSLTITAQATHTVSTVTLAIADLKEIIKDSSKSIYQLVKSTKVR